MIASYCKCIRRRPHQPQAQARRALQKRTIGSRSLGLRSFPRPPTSSDADSRMELLTGDLGDEVPEAVVEAGIEDRFVESISRHEILRDTQSIFPVRAAYALTLANRVALRHADERA